MVTIRHPCEQVVLSFEAEQTVQQAAVTPVNLGPFHTLLADVAVVGREAPHQERSLQIVEICVHRVVREAAASADLAGIPWSLGLDEVEQYRREGCLLVESILDDEDLRLLDEAVREVTEAAIGSPNQAELIELEPDGSGSTRRVHPGQAPTLRHAVNPKRPAFNSKEVLFLFS